MEDMGRSSQWSVTNSFKKIYCSKLKCHFTFQYAGCVVLVCMIFVTVTVSHARNPTTAVSINCVSRYSFDLTGVRTYPNFSFHPLYNALLLYLLLQNISSFKLFIQGILLVEVEVFTWLHMVLSHVPVYHNT